MDDVVSIIIPVYNCEKYVRKCIESICNQSYSRLEIIVIDDGSNDSSADIINEYCNIDNRIIFIRQKNQGVCVARNNALEIASGKYITFIDGDDWVEYDYIEKMYYVAEQNDSDLVISGFIMEDANGNNRRIIKPGDYKRFDDEMWAYRLSAACGRLYKKSFWNENGIKYTLQKGVRAEDVPICLLTNYIAKNIRTISYSGYHYIQHKGSATSQFIGLKTHGFPYDAMNELKEKIELVNNHNSKEFLDVGLLKFFAQFYILFGMGAERVKKNEMRIFFSNYLNDMSPEFAKSWKIVKKKAKNELHVRIAITLFIMQNKIWKKQNGIFGNNS